MVHVPQDLESAVSLQIIFVDQQSAIIDHICGKSFLYCFSVTPS